MAPEPAYQEQDVLTACALRFDGYKYLEQVLEDDRSVIDAHVDQGTIPEDPFLRMTMFFLLQRYLMKWGGEHEPKHGKFWRLFRQLFFAVVDQPVPMAFQHEGNYQNWVQNYEPCRAQCVKVVRAVHEATEYDDAAYEP